VYIPPRIDSANFLLLNRPNAFGNYQRFTGTTGGYKSGATYYDADGVSTTEALALPNNIILDWGQSNYDVIPSITRVFNSPAAGGNLTTQLSNVAAQNSAVFGGYSDWTLPQEDFWIRLLDQTLAPTCLNFDPFNNTEIATATATTYSKNARADLPTQQYIINTSIRTLANAIPSATRACFMSREYTYAELGISF